jgi:hypothetical protein
VPADCFQIVAETPAAEGGQNKTPGGVSGEAP